MRFLNVKLKNFKSYGDVETTIDLNFNGMKLISGTNGVGKTTAIEAILWCLYGKAISEKVGNVVNRRNKKNCKVELNFRIGCNEFSVIRYREHEKQGNKLLFFKNGKNISDRIAGNTQQLILDTIEIQYKAMENIIILSSELYQPFLRSRISERLQIFENILSLREVNEYYKILKEKREVILNKISEEEQKINEIQIAIDSTEKNINTYKDNAKSVLLSLKNEREKKVDELRKTNEALTEYESIDVDSHILNNEKYDKAQIINKEANAELQKLEEKLKLIDTSINNFAKEFNDISKLNDDLGKIDVNTELVIIKEYLDKKDIKKDCDNKLELLKLKIKNVDAIKKSVDAIKKNVDVLNLAIDEMSSHSEVCPTCGQSVNKDLTDKLINEKQTKLDSENLELNKLLKEYKLIEDENNLIKEEINKIKELVSSQKLNFLEEPLYEKDFLLSLKHKIEGNEKNKEVISLNIRNLEAEKNNIKEKINEVKSKIVLMEDPQYHTIFLHNLKEKINEFKIKTEEIRTEITVIDSKAKTVYDKEYAEKLASEIKSAQKKKVKLENGLLSVKKEDNHYEALMDILSNKESGFKKFFINKMISSFNERVNFYLPFFFDVPISIEFKRDLSEVITYDGEIVDFDTFSRGQKGRLEMSVLLSLYMMVKTFFSSTINLICFDEILDNFNLDEIGVRAFISLLENISNQNAVFIVSHDNRYKDKIPNHIVIAQDENKNSYIVSNN